MLLPAAAGNAPPASAGKQLASVCTQHCQHLPAPQNFGLHRIPLDPNTPIIWQQTAGANTSMWTSGCELAGLAQNPL